MMAEPTGRADAKAGRQRAYRRGQLAEAAAAGFLMAKGFRIVARRFKTPHGEIDLIARRGSLIVFAEVKSRADLVDAAYSITPRQQKRIVDAARLWLARGEVAEDDFDMRFDAILVGRVGLRHIKSAFETA